MSSTLILINLLITIAIVIVLILKLKLNPVISLVLGSLYMGIASGVGMVKTVSAITTGFGGLMSGIGLSVGFGVMLGQLVADSGGVQSIANTMLKLTKKERAHYGLGATGFIVSIPVFYDVGYVILTPLARTLAKSAKTLPYFVGALVAGLGITHTFVPPTPGPMTGGQLLGIDIGTTIMWGIIIGLPTFLIVMWAYGKFFLDNPKFWSKDADEDPMYDEAGGQQKAKEATVVSEGKLPSFGAAMLPILLPVVLILIGTATAAVTKTPPEWVKFISDKNIAMLAGVFASMLIARSTMTGDQIQKSIGKSLSDAGIVLLITGAGGSLGTVLTTAGVGGAITALMKTVAINPILLAWMIASLMKLAQGSGTVAMITAVSILAPAVPTLGVAPILVALAAFSGSLFGGHVNDSGFWITTKIAGLTTSGGLKTYTLVCAMEAVVSLVLIFACSLVL